MKIKEQLIASLQSWQESKPKLFNRTANNQVDLDKQGIL